MPSELRLGDLNREIERLVDAVSQRVLGPRSRVLDEE